MFSFSDERFFFFYNLYQSVARTAHNAQVDPQEIFFDFFIRQPACPTDGIYGGKLEINVWAFTVFDYSKRFHTMIRRRRAAHMRGGQGVRSE